MSTTTCSKCGGIVRLDRGACPSCGAARIATMTVDLAPSSSVPPRREDMTIQIRSRLMWGDDPSEIRNEFVKLGARAAEVDGLLRTAIQQRKDFYRKLGLKNVIGGGALLVLGALFMVCCHVFFSGAGGRLPIWFLLASITFPVGGSLLLFKGARRMMKPGEGETTAHGEFDED
jgi:hypothetical protein